MLLLLSGLVSLFLILLLARLWRMRGKGERAQTDASVETTTPEHSRPEGCCGLHEVCEREHLLAAANVEPDYYDDEELDQYRGRPADSYNAAEVEAFDYVLTTMRPGEVAGWLRSLAQRGIELPTELRDEAILLVGEPHDVQPA